MFQTFKDKVKNKLHNQLLHAAKDIDCARQFGRYRIHPNLLMST